MTRETQSRIHSPLTGATSVLSAVNPPPFPLSTITAKICWGGAVPPDTGHGFWWINKTAAGTRIIRWLQWHRGGRVIGFSEALVVLDNFPSFTVISHTHAFILSSAFQSSLHPREALHY